MTHEQFKKAADYWKNKEMTAMPKEELKKAVEEYIASNNTCALATGTGDYVRCTPIEYSYHNDKFWMFSEGGEKFIGLEKNENVCLAIFDKYDGFGRLKSVQVMGKAELIEPFSDKYNEHAKEALAVLRGHGDDQPADAPCGEGLQHPIVGAVEGLQLQEGIDTEGEIGKRHGVTCGRVRKKVAAAAY